jgi:RNA polymerase sigma-70 factor (ECF subfamily)
VDKFNLSDQELVTKYIDGDQSSLEILVHRHKSRIFSYIYLMVRNQHLAEDIFQDTFVKVIKSLHQGKYHDDGKFVSWVTRISHNLVIDHFRKEKQLKIISDDACEISVFNSKKLSEKNVEELIIDDQIADDVRKLLDFLPDDQREVVVLRHYAGMSFKEIADHTNVSINTALGRMRYALINMRRLINEKDICLTK